MSHPHQLTNCADVLAYILGGHGTFTVKSVKTGDHYTFHTYHFKGRTRHNGRKPALFLFAALRTGSDEDDYTYIGKVRQSDSVSGLYRLDTTRASERYRNSKPFRAFNWLLARLAASKDLPQEVEFWHEGRCCRCGRQLTTPESIERGMGPVCAERE